MSATYDCADPASRAEGLKAAALALRTGELVVLPTDTLYGIGADAFYPSAVTGLLAAKGRGRDMPPPVLVGTVRAAAALIEDLGPYGKDLIDEFWPGGLTLVCRANRSLNWDLGETRGTVAIRMPLHPVALELLKETGPLAVSSANRTGSPGRHHGRRGAGAARRCGLRIPGRRAVQRRTLPPRSWISPGACPGCCGRAPCPSGGCVRSPCCPRAGMSHRVTLTFRPNRLPGREGRVISPGAAGWCSRVIVMRYIPSGTGWRPCSSTC